MSTPGASRREGGIPEELPAPLDGSATVTVEVADSIAALQSLQPDYQQLQRLTGNTLPFALYEWHLVWCQQFLNIHKRIDTEMMIHVLRDQNRGCVGVVPLMRTRRGVGPLRINTIDLLGADPGVTEIRAPLIASGYERRAAHLVQKSILGAPPHWVQWSGVTAEFGAALADRAKLRWQAPTLDYILDLPASWEELRAQLKRNIRESIRHCYNSLKRDGLHAELRTASGLEEVRAAIERFKKLHTLRAARADTIKHHDVFALTSSCSFLHGICEHLAPRGILRVFELYLNGEVVATRLGFVIDKSLYLYYSGYDPAWSKYSVMTTTLVETLKYAIASGLTTVNLSPGNDVSKTRWAPRVVEYAQAAQVFPNFFGEVAWNAYRRVRDKEAAGLPQFLGLTRLIKRTWV